MHPARVEQQPEETRSTDITVCRTCLANELGDIMKLMRVTPYKFADPNGSWTASGVFGRRAHSRFGQRAFLGHGRTEKRRRFCFPVTWATSYPP